MSINIFWYRFKNNGRAKWVQAAVNVKNHCCRQMSAV